MKELRFQTPKSLIFKQVIIAKEQIQIIDNRFLKDTIYFKKGNNVKYQILYKYENTIEVATKLKIYQPVY